MRTSITYLPSPTLEHPQGYILHLKKNFQYNNRGTIFPLGMARPKDTAGATKRQGKGTLILRGDQQEWVRGKERWDGQRKKEEKRAAKGGKDYGDDWEPALLLGEKGRTGTNENGVRTGKDGLPIIGVGRRVRFRLLSACASFTDAVLMLYRIQIKLRTRRVDSHRDPLCILLVFGSYDANCNDIE